MSHYEDQIYELQMDKITDQMERLFLSIIFCALEKICEKNLELIKSSILSNEDDMSF